MGMNITEIAMWAEGNFLPILIALMILITMVLTLLIIMNIQLTTMKRRYNKMMQGVENENIETMLLKHVEQVQKTTIKMNELTNECARLQQQAQTCVQRVGVVRFNAFENTGSDLSFAVALLDASKNGVIISSIFGRNDSRTYAKPIIEGRSTYFLSDEEQAALKQAEQKNIGK